MSKNTLYPFYSEVSMMCRYVKSIDDWVTQWPMVIGWRIMIRQYVSVNKKDVSHYSGDISLIDYTLVSKICENIEIHS